MSVPTTPCCWNPERGIRLSIEDEAPRDGRGGRFGALRLEVQLGPPTDGTRYTLQFDRRPAVGSLSAGQYYLQDLQSDAYVRDGGEGGRRQGAGTLLMNTAVQYLRALADADYPRVTGFLYAAAGEPPQRHAERRRFFGYFFPDEAFDGDDFDVQVAALRTRPDRLPFDRLPTLVPFTKFGPCEA